MKIHPSNMEYSGGGWFRDKNVPKGKVSPLVHAPELLSAFIEELKNPICAVCGVGWHDHGEEEHDWSA